MSSCPKCGKKLKLFDLGQICPNCGVNMRFYGFEEQFYKDAKVAELSIANVNVKIRRMKVSFIGGKLPILRLCLMLLPLLSLLLPSVNAEVSLPFAEQTFSLSALGLFNAFSDGSLNALLSLTGAQAGGEVFAALRNVIFAEAAAALFAVLSLLFCLLCFFSIKKMSALICAVSGLGLVSAVLTGIFAKIFVSCATSAALPIISGSMSFGFILTVVCFAALFTLNLLIAKNGLPVEYEEGDLERAELYKKYRKGELNIDDCPQPIVETAATRAIDEEIAKENSKYDAKEETTV